MRVNELIRARQVRVIAVDGSQIGVVDTDKAKQLAQEAGLDLVEVAPQETPPVCRIMDYGKFKYKQKKRTHQKKHHLSQLKELRLRPKTEDHDFQTKLGHARKFLARGDKVQVNMLFRGREMARIERGRDVLARFAEALKEIAKVEQAPRMEGRRMNMIIAARPSGAGGQKTPTKKDAEPKPTNAKAKTS
ncbi:MAG: translation initiation factor IF-3 [Planctomycetota bacterium]|nr:translation initiation factor IF-3 [Planctomycetota bacterium]